ncbi:MAG: virulence factor [Thiolinea sp.]
MPQKIVVYWRDIPSQIIIKKGRAKGKAVLSQRFQEAIDRAAMRAGMADTDSYVEQWRRETADYETEGDIQTVAEAVAQEYEVQYNDDVLSAMVRNKGLTAEA